MTYRAYCPLPGECERKEFIAPTEKEAVELVRQHIKANLEDPNHSDIAEKEGWLDPDPDPLGD